MHKTARTSVSVSPALHARIVAARLVDGETIESILRRVFDVYDARLAGSKPVLAEATA